jgi:hypothetical protein
VTSDLYELEPEMTGQFLYNEWTRVWAGATQEYSKKRESHKFYGVYQELHHVDDKTPLVHTTTTLMNYGSHHGKLRDLLYTFQQFLECIKPKDVPEPNYPSIIRRLFQMFKWEFIGSTVAKLFSDILQYVNPLLLG